MIGRQKEREMRKLKSKAKASRAIRIQKLLWGRKIRSADQVPENAIPADLLEQNRDGQRVSRLWYVDMPYRCKDCGKSDTWCALEQLWYYEIAKGPLKSEATRCETCRVRHRSDGQDQTKRLKEATEMRSVAKAASAIAAYLQMALVNEAEKARLLDLAANRETHKRLLESIPTFDQILNRTVLRKKLHSEVLDRPALLYAPPSTFGAPVARLKEIVALESGPFVAITRDGKAGIYQPGASKDSRLFFEG